MGMVRKEFLQHLTRLGLHPGRPVLSLGPHVPGEEVRN